MAWLIKGNGSAIVLRVTGTGFPEIGGTAESHEASAAGGNTDETFFHRLKQLECVWSISCSDASEMQRDVTGDGFIKVVSKNPDTTHASIRYFRDPESVGVNIVVPPTAFGSIWDVCKLLLRSPTLSYIISLDFIGFHGESASTGNPTMRDFLDSKPYFSHEASFSIRRVAPSA